MKICEKCGGTGKIEKPISLSKTALVECDICGGSGELPVSMEDIAQRLDRIIEKNELIIGRLEKIVMRLGEALK